MEKEIQWLTEYDEKLEKMVSDIADVMKQNKIEIMTFFVDYQEIGYMIQAYDDFDWFEVTKRERTFGED